MNALGALGGVGLGITRSAEDYRRWEEEARRKAKEARELEEFGWRRDEQGRLRGLQTEADDLATQMRGGQLPTAATNQDWAPGEGGPSLQAGQPLPVSPYSGGLSDAGISRRMASLETRRGNGAAAMQALAAARALELKDRKAKWFAEQNQYTDEQLQERYGNMLNQNLTVPGSVGYDKASKRWVVSDYDGKGSVAYLTRQEALDAAYQNFLAAEGDVDEALKRGNERYDRILGRVRADVASGREGAKTAGQLNNWQTVGDAAMMNARANMARASTESAALRNLQERQKLLTEYGANVEGYEAAKRLGLTKATDAGPSAADIYASRGANLAAQLRGLGANVTLPGQERIQRKVQVQKNEAGGFTAFDAETGAPLYNVSSTGKQLPLGVDESTMAIMAAEARVNGVALATVDLNGMLVPAFVSNDGRQWETMEEAKEANKAGIRQDINNRLREARSRSTGEVVLPEPPGGGSSVMYSE